MLILLAFCSYLPLPSRAIFTVGSEYNRVHAKLDLALTNRAVQVGSGRFADPEDAWGVDRVPTPAARPFALAPVGAGRLLNLVLALKV